MEPNGQNQAYLGYAMAIRIDELASKTHFSKNEKRTKKTNIKDNSK